MKKSPFILIAILIALIAAAGGYFAGHRQPISGASGDASDTAPMHRKIRYWKAPMDPNFHSDKPGKSPMGMDLVPVYADDSGSGEASDVKIDPVMVNNLGVQTVEVKAGSLAHPLSLVGYVGYDEDTITSINTRADGWIEKLAVKSAGDAVRAGQLLYELFSPKLATAEREYLTALASDSPSLIAASRERMRALGFTAAQIQQLGHTRKVSDRVARYADSAGVVMNLGVSEGVYVMPSTQVMKLADLHAVWVLVEVDESQAGLLHVGQKADATFDAFPGQHWQGTVDYVYPDLNAMTRTVKARLRFDNQDLRLQPNMYAHVTIAAMAQKEGTAAPSTSAVYIPNLALIRTGNSQRVIVALGEGRFDVCPVQAGLTSGDQVEILKGLQAGQRVVSSAQFLIDSEANVDAAALNYGSAKPGCSETPSTSGTGAAIDGKPGSQDMRGMDMSSKPAGGAPEAPARTPSMEKTDVPSPPLKGEKTPPSGNERDMQNMPMPARGNKGHQS
ncbi:efflux RND transporter periplasmic adaptor subunit [Oleiagrimonas sp. C23AA]|uniref:efflux RND transporter periplasmic adaptor subunit n=1 Tax=Oleiagrimonas sp. C23AA TaxID=2719047 RepID=UPI00141F8A8D|nr:efflux RND transporter periplasmic adaptor subunit [Oleiagrimonas sp. C23AA]NII11033.1 efflux RND transporter periplasmic adaptor subunit [Oleiagrimonas sp. C23AA]